MGIPNLITHLRPYTTTTDLQHQHLIIDGPGFAYHIYHNLLSSAPQTKNPFEALPSYAEIGDTAVQWLEEFENLGVNM